MQVSDKLIKPLTEAKYLNADNVSRYRCIMRIFFEHYEKCRSEKVISPKRMKILERITDGRLKPVVDRIEEYGTAGYQEMLVEEM